jgi:hypothetical protein
MILNRLLTQLDQKEVPLLNYAEYISTNEAFQEYRQKSRKMRLMNLVKNSPEALSVIRIVSGDIWTKYHFEALEKGQSARNKIIKAEEFATTQKFKKIGKNSANDLIITGEGFNWKGALSDAQVKSVTPKDMPGLEINKMRKLRHIASTTMITNHDEYDVTGYTQFVGPQGVMQKLFSVDEIIKLSLEELDGKVDGFTPLMTLPLHIELLWLMWQNQYMLQKRGNHPDLVVSAMGISENSPSYKKIKNELQSYNTPGKPNHGTLFFSAGRDSKLDVKQLEKVDDLQFKEVDQYVTSLIAMMWQVPASRLGIKTEQAANSKDSNSSGDRAYWYNIQSMQDIIAEIYNSELWMPYFGVKMVFDKSYLQDDIAENNATALRLANLQTSMTLLRNKGKSLGEETILNIINDKYDEITEDDLEELSEDEKMLNMPKTGMLATPKSDSTQDLASQKRKEEVNREKGAGKPTGF